MISTSDQVRWPARDLGDGELFAAGALKLLADPSRLSSSGGGHAKVAESFRLDKRPRQAGSPGEIDPCARLRVHILHCRCAECQG